MIGKILSKAVKIVTLPVDIIEGTFDVMSGGDGSVSSRRDSGAAMMTEIREGICKAIESIDE